ncbi:MAG: hypothetical protein IMX04_05720 [Candidatus Carbobacillus altaicus]|uniref:Protein PsiE n=1 Tax=Candidatus Carbonibacillus altaicus TaxID=2163959 RepID=A0A2R6XYE5_9BACL|nr:hypothetical protein [Candidatus Carbobacillus altaicus]PTQ55422.1 MAG: hypothetical protein BSOLF_2131 [Candidatus Carbobacillus altaicus]
MKRANHFLQFIIHWFEWLLAVIIIFAVFGEGAMMVSALYDYIRTWELTEKFHTFLSDALLYIIGLEIALLLLKRDLILIIDIMIYTIARKVIIQNVAIWEVLLAVLAIAILYLLKLYGATLGQKVRQMAVEEIDEERS